MRALDHLDDAAFTTATAIETCHPYQRPITIEHQAHLRWAEEQVVAAVIRHEEAKAVTVTADATTDQVELVHRGIGATAGIDELTITLHCAQSASQGFELIFGMQTELFDQLFTTGRRAALGQMRKNQLTAGDGVVVFFRLAGGLGIEGLPIGHVRRITCAYL